MAALLELGSGFHPELSGRENVYLNGAILGLTKKDIDRRFDEIVEFAGLERFIDTPVKNYSSGMFVRLGFAVAVNVEPEILIIDEVLAVGDASFQKKCMEKFAEYRVEGKTLIIVTHDLGTVRSMADRVVWLSYGEIKEEGDAGEVTATYADDALGERHEDEGEHEFRFGSGEVVINHVTILGADGKPTQKLKTGDDVTIRYEYEARVPVREPVFGLGIQHISGPLVSGPNTRDTRRHPCRPHRLGHRRHHHQEPAAAPGHVRPQRVGLGLPDPPRLRPAQPGDAVRRPPRRPHGGLTGSSRCGRSGPSRATCWRRPHGTRPAGSERPGPDGSGAVEAGTHPSCEADRRQRHLTDPERLAGAQRGDLGLEGGDARRRRAATP